MDPIQVNYSPDGDDWAITVNGRGQTLTATAPGLIAARDQADQLVEKLTPNEENRTVVHLLDGDAVAFTTAYLNARLAKTDVAEAGTDTGETATESPDEPNQPESQPDNQHGARTTHAATAAAESSGTSSTSGTNDTGDTRTANAAGATDDTAEAAGEPSSESTSGSTSEPTSESTNTVPEPAEPVADQPEVASSSS